MLNQEQIALLKELNTAVQAVLPMLNVTELMPEYGIICYTTILPIKHQFEQWKIVLHFNEDTGRYVAITQEDNDLLLQLNQSVRSMLFFEVMEEYTKLDENIAAITDELKQRGFLLLFKNGRYIIGE